jgi:hypothetical protein
MDGFDTFRLIGFTIGDVLAQVRLRLDSDAAGKYS